jgi:hypothetical protein
MIKRALRKVRAFEHETTPARAEKLREAIAEKMRNLNGGPS